MGLSAPKRSPCLVGRSYLRAFVAEAGREGIERSISDHGLDTTAQITLLARPAFVVAARAGWSASSGAG